MKASRTLIGFTSHVFSVGFHSCIGAFFVLLSSGALGQAEDGQNSPARQSPRENAPIDLTGNWVSIVSEDWRVRMLMGQKGDWLFMMGRYGSLNEEGLRVAENSEPENEDPCKAYGAAGIMRIPGRLQIAWETDEVLKIETDAGKQTRRLYFESGAEPDEHTRQGYTEAAWMNGQLEATTRHMTPGYYFKHGVPYSEEAVMTEYFVVLPDVDTEYLMITTSVIDPIYLNGTYDRTLTFKREPDDSKWAPSDCVVP